jgi:hypothetical protein
MKKWKDTTIPEDLIKDPEYGGHLRSGGVGGSRQYSHTLKISDLRQRDSAEYKLTQRTQDGRTANMGQLFVTGLKVRKNPDTVKEGQKVTLTCSTKCTLSDNLNPAYLWYKNGQQLINPKTLNTSLHLDPFNITDAGSYSCAVNDIRSPALCVLDNSWDVRYTNKTICAITGSSVDMPCTCTYPSGQTITQTLWSKTVDPKGKPEDLEYEQAFLIDLVRVSWKDIDLIQSVEDAWLFFKSAFLTILNKHASFKNKLNIYSPWFTPDLTALDQHKKTFCGVLY